MAFSTIMWPFMKCLTESSYLMWCNVIYRLSYSNMIHLNDHKWFRHLVWMPKSLFYFKMSIAHVYYDANLDPCADLKLLRRFTCYIYIMPSEDSIVKMSFFSFFLQWTKLKSISLERTCRNVSYTATFLTHRLSWYNHKTLLHRGY